MLNPVARLTSRSAEPDVSDETPAETKRGRAPEWHRLRLFGRGRHPDTFDAGTPVRANL